MKRICILFCILLAVLIFLPSCDGNVFVTPDVSEEVDTTVHQVTEHLGKDVDYTFRIPPISLADMVFDMIQPEEEERKILPDEEMHELLDFLIPLEIKISVDLKRIPNISRETMNTLLLLDKPQDIRIVNQILGLKIEGKSKEAVAALYDVFARMHDSSVDGGLIQFGNVIRIPTDDYSDYTFGDYLAVQMILSLITDTIPNAFINNYVAFKPVDSEKKLEEYVASLGDNIVRTLLIDDSILLHIVGTYTFLNKYNPSTTILDMRNLGTFFALEE